jgi:hypothetical protein
MLNAVFFEKYDCHFDLRTYMMDIPHSFASAQETTYDRSFIIDINPGALLLGQILDTGLSIESIVLWRRYVVAYFPFQYLISDQSACLNIFLAELSVHFAVGSSRCANLTAPLASVVDSDDTGASSMATILYRRPEV